MMRREFISLLGGAIAWPIAVRAQQPTVPVIGYLSFTSPDERPTLLAAFRQGLEQEGYVIGRNVAIEYRSAAGNYELLPSLARELVKIPVEVIAATGGEASGRAAKAATAQIPIVFTSGSDAVKAGLVASLNRPGGNVTGVSLLASALSGKKFALLRDLVPGAAAIGALVNPGYAGVKAQVDEFQAAAAQLGVGLVVLSAETDEDIKTAFASLTQQHIGALVIANDLFFGGHRDQLVELAATYGVPVMHFQREFVTAGGLMSYGPSFDDGYRQGGVYVGRILKGEKPADLPVIRAAKFEFIINLQTARTLHIEVPQTLLASADEVIE